MLTQKEWEQVELAIRFMQSPMSIGNIEYCSKEKVLAILKKFTEQEE